MHITRVIHDESDSLAEQSRMGSSEALKKYDLSVTFNSQFVWKQLGISIEM